MDAMDPVHLSSELLMSLNDNAGGTPAAAEGTSPEEEEMKLSPQEEQVIDVFAELLPRSTDEELLMQLWDMEHPGLLRQFGIELEEAPDSCEAMCKAPLRSLAGHRYFRSAGCCFPMPLTSTVPHSRSFLRRRLLRFSGFDESRFSRGDVSLSNRLLVLVAHPASMIHLPLAADATGAPAGSSQHYTSKPCLDLLDRASAAASSGDAEILPSPDQAAKTEAPARSLLPQLAAMGQSLLTTLSPRPRCSATGPSA